MLKQQIGIDKLIINNLRIKSLDMKKLSSYTINVRLQEIVDIRHIENINDVNKAYYLKIKDDYDFVNMTSVIYQYKNSTAIHTQYCIIELSVSNIMSNNLNNLSVQRYQDYIHHDLIEYIKVKYGIIIEVNEAKIKEIEINTSLLLEKKFKEYNRILYILISLLSKHFKKINVYFNPTNKALDHETISRGNKSKIVKIYNKSKQLNDKNSILSKEEKELINNSDIMRIEFSLLNNKVIKSAFNTTLLNDLTDNKINDYYINEFDKMFVKKYEKWKTNNRKQLLKLIKKHKIENHINWQYSFLNECKSIENNNNIAMLLDINDLKDIIYKYYNQDRHASRIMKSLIKKCDKNDPFLHDDSKKIDEIFKKVHEAYHQK